MFSSLQCLNLKSSKNVSSRDDSLKKKKKKNLTINQYYQDSKITRSHCCLSLLYVQYRFNSHAYDLCNRAHCRLLLSLSVHLEELYCSVFTDTEALKTIYV